MERYMPTTLKLKPPAVLARHFVGAPLLGSESREEYDLLREEIAAAMKPADAREWFSVEEYTYLSYEMNREKIQKDRIIKAGMIMEAARLLYDRNHPDADKLLEEVKLWVNDFGSQPSINQALGDRGYSADELERIVRVEAEKELEAIDRRIASLDFRRMANLKTLDFCKESRARRVTSVVSEIIEGEFREAED